jgi:hypothetical protein
MLASITPLGERGRGSRWSVTVAFFVAGSVSAGMIIGTTVAALGHVIGMAGAAEGGRLLVLAGLVLLGFVVDVGVGRLRVPTIYRQVNEQWLFEFRGWFYGVGFGFQLGLGVVTIVTTSSVYLLLAASFLSAWPFAGALIGGAFGLVRAGTILSAARIHSPDRLERLGRALDRWDAPFRRATQAGMLAVAFGVGALAAW